LGGPYGNYDRSVRAARISAMWRERFGIDAPRKIICVGLNYRDHAEEQGAALPEEPLLFAKFANALLDPGDPIPLPPESSHVDAEAELAVVIGASSRRVREDEALGLVAGYTCANDVSARDLQRRDGQWLRAKSFDGFCPLLPEPASVDELGDAAGLRVIQRLNGEVLQDGTTSDLIFGVPRLVAHASTVFTLEPGDVILTGTPAGVGVHRDPPVALKAGDTVEVEIERIGVLANPVATER
jgi:2-keto-4-pentenoate hydratase/2-oxohepta-3-ene-1,7-dioic acid hydratase in catechol pathway